MGKGGVVRDPRVHRQVLADLAAWMSQHGWHLLGMTRSPLVGPAGNREFLVWLIPGGAAGEEQVNRWIECAMQESESRED